MSWDVDLTSSWVWIFVVAKEMFRISEIRKNFISKLNMKHSHEESFAAPNY